MKDPLKANLPVTMISGWSLNNDTGNYHMRWRHSGNNTANLLFLDGHVASCRYTPQEAKMRNFATGY